MNMSYVFINVAGFTILSIIAFCAYIYYVDKTQTKHSLRRNFPLLARGRWLMESIGHFFRYYMVADDRQEYPFNRADRTTVYKMAKNNNMTEAFGSSQKPDELTFSFVHSNYPYIEKESEDYSPSILVYGATTENPYHAKSRINISAMSHGALSNNAVLALGKGAKMGGFLQNTGEGGLSQSHVDGGADLIYQIGTAKYGCANPDSSLNVDKLEVLASNPQIKMFEIKMSQGAKPGKGGILPAVKVTEDIAKARDIPVGQASISPNGHVEVHDDSTMIELIHKVKKHSKKPTGIKLCLGSEEQFESLISTLAQKRFELIESGQPQEAELFTPDFITVDSSDGGTGAAPAAHMDAMGMHIRVSMPFVIQTLIKYNLRERIRLIVSGKLMTPVWAAWAFANGADAINIARGFLFSLGCIQARKCNKNTCPTGITTHDPRFTNGLNPEEKSVRVYSYHKNLEHELTNIAHSCGVKTYDLLNKKHIRKNELINVRCVN